MSTGIVGMDEQRESFNIAKVVNDKQAIITSIRKILDNNHTVINNKKYVLKNGWQALAVRCGFTIHTKPQREIEDGKTIGFYGHAQLKDKDGMVRSEASSYCSLSERYKDRYAVIGMAETRAANRACSQMLGFLLDEIGFASTPAEEMQGVQSSQQPHSTNKEAYQQNKKKLDFFFKHHKDYDALKEKAREIWGTLKPDDTDGKMTKDTIKKALPLIKEWGEKYKQLKEKDKKLGEEATKLKNQQSESAAEKTDEPPINDKGYPSGWDERESWEEHPA